MYTCYMDEAKLRELTEDKLTIAEMADHFNASKSTVRYWMKKYDIKTFRGAGGKHPAGYKSPRNCPCGETDPKKFYGNKTNTCGRCHNQYTIKSGRKQRDKIIAHLGGRCSQCSYDKFRSALHVHHLEPDKKDPRWNQSKGWTWKRTLKELRDCILLCANCHAAHHNDDLELTGMWRNGSAGALGASGWEFEPPHPDEGNLGALCPLVRMIQFDTDYRPKNDDVLVKVQLANKKCTDCDTRISKRATRCNSCSVKSRGTKIDWPSDDELREMIAESNYYQLGFRLGVSDNAIRKRLGRGTS